MHMVFESSSLQGDGALLLYILLELQSLANRASAGASGFADQASVDRASILFRRIASPAVDDSSVVICGFDQHTQARNV